LGIWGSKVFKLTNGSGGSMKRLVLSLMMAGGLALMAAPKASAGIFGGCGKTYAVLLQGAQETTTDNGQATGTVGVGSITFGAAGTAGTDPSRPAW